MADMVKMVVGHQDSRERIHIHIVLLKYLLEASQAYAGVDDYAPVFSTQIIAVSAASAGKAHKLYHP
jgi:hypothetical protein